MSRKITRSPLIESILISSIIGCINLFFSSDPGFGTLFFLPYIAGILIISSYYGFPYGFISILSAAVWITGLLPLSIFLFASEHAKGPWRASFRAACSNGLITAVPFSFLAAYLFGSIRENFFDELSQIRKRYKELVKENWLLKKTANALSVVDRELEERVSSQRESITILHNQIRKMAGRKFKETLSCLLETVKFFTEAGELSLWEYRRSTSTLRLVSSLGWDPSPEEEVTLSLDESIEGWVCRNNSMFSLRMLLQYDHLKHLDGKRNILTCPVVLFKRVWGVLNIEKMPFVKYSGYTEKLLQIIISLAGPSLEQAFEYETLIKTGEIDEETALPAFSQFKVLLQSKINAPPEDIGNLSIILLDISNYDELLKQFDPHSVHSLFPEIASQLEIVSGSRGKIFQYRERNQLAMIIPNIDHDGASLLCLEILEIIGSHTWNIAGLQIHLEAVIGFASLGPEIDTVETLMDKAEHLLKIQAT